jgi:hypothetical protein
MQSVILPISYVSRTGQLETMTFTCGITTPVSNATARESIAEIKQRAPARYYTQNRMVNGEDYNNFPFTAYNSILKSKAINRSSIGTSRYLDLVDNTGKYSSTNTFGSDGALYENYSLPSFLYRFLTNNEIADVITNRVQPILADSQVQQFYYENFPRGNLLVTNTTWHLSTTLANTTTGYFQNVLKNPVPIGPFTSDFKRYITVGSLVKFVPPAGYFFDENNRLKAGTPLRPNEKLVIWASPLAVVVDGTAQGAGNLPDGSGPVTLNNYVPEGAIADQVIPIFVTDLPVSFESQMAEQIRLNRNFGIGYDSLGLITGTAGTWYLITSTNLDVDAPWSQNNAGSTAGLQNDASWLVQFVTDGSTYTISFRALDYYFGSVLQTRFFYYGDQKIYDSRSGTVISDFVKVLKTNSQPDVSLPLTGDLDLKIVGQPVQSDGYVDDFQVLVSYSDSDSDGVPDNPDFFSDVVAPTVNANQKLVFLQKTVDFDNLERYLLVERGRVNSSYATKNDIELVKQEFVPGQVFYAYTDQTFWTLTIDTVTGSRDLVANNEFIARTGRQDLYFQYRHNSPLTSRIDPGTTNIIDLYVVTNEYYTSYQNYIRDISGTVPEPIPPSIDQLTTQYGGLQDFKMISDSVIVNSVEFKPLFGDKAAEELRATIKVIKSANSTASVSEIKNLVITNLNNYFTLDKWDFGDTFYFSELSAYLHAELGGIISSVVLVPLNPQKYFGDLYEIRSAPNQIFVNAANVNNVEVIEALTSTNIRTAPGSGVI